MHLKPAAPVLGVAAAVVLAIAAYQVFGGNVGAPTTPTPTPRAFAPGELPGIVLTGANAPEGFTVDATTEGYDALTTPLRPGGEVISQDGFVDALMTNLNTTETGGFVSWSALYETTEQAERAFDFLVTEHQSDAGWGLERVSEAPSLGDESVSFEGAAYQFDEARVHVWRVGNLLLAAVAVGDVAVGADEADRLQRVAEEMDARAH